MAALVYKWSPYCFECLQRLFRRALGSQRGSEPGGIALFSLECSALLRSVFLGARAARTKNIIGMSFRERKYRLTYTSVIGQNVYPFPLECHFSDTLCKRSRIRDMVGFHLCWNLT